MRILVVTGKSAGHIYPALSFLDCLKDKYKKTDCLFVMPSKNIRIPVPLEGFKVKYLCLDGFKLKPDAANFIALLRFFKGIFQSFILLLEFKPDVVVGFGGLGSVPLVGLAWMSRVNTLIHEQNVLPGRANRLLSRLADYTAISFPKTKDYLKISEKRILLTGNPVRKELKRVPREEAVKFFGLDNDKFTILVMGGSSGSHSINMNFSQVVFGPSSPLNLQAIHISGAKDYSYLAGIYKGLKTRVRLFEFLRSMQYAYSASDLCLCRAGASTISELIEFNLPAILIPYPFAYKHQFCNAQVLGEIGAAKIIKDEYLDSGTLRKSLEELIGSPKELSAMRDNYNRIQRLKSDELLVEKALSLANGNL